LPGSIFSSLSSGKVQISNEFADSIDSGFYINKYLSLEDGGELADLHNKTSENSILKLLRDEPMTIDELSKYVSISVSDISAELTTLSLSGLVSENGG